MKHILRLFSFVPMLLVMYMIWSFSAQGGGDSANVSMKAGLRIVRIVDRLFSAGFTEEQVVRYAVNLQPFVRKGAHVAEYFLLALCSTLPVYVYGFGGLWPFIVAGLVCVAFAGADELHQTFVDGRDGAIRDVLIDGAGALMGIFISGFFKMRRK
ncbi:MAG: VanZ family protein [Lachnospiraceae bacterium]|nr:VanZ family protein [Lachnospiraceae bacterium]